jgi:predicted Rossmann fold flavoprotein
MGATSFGYDLARQFGLEIVEPRAALVPLVFSPEDADNWCDLTGLSAEAIISTDSSSKSKSPRPTFREKLLITHRGLSGPAILQISSYWQPGQPIEIDLAPGREITAPLLAPGAHRDHAALSLSLRTALPQRLADRWLRLHLAEANAVGMRTAFTNAALAEFEQHLHAWRVIPAGTEGYAKAEVAAGGVSTAELDSSTMQSRRIPGLYFIGEVVDVTGWLGGYNFQWAWASGFAAGQSA